MVIATTRNVNLNAVVNINSIGQLYVLLNCGIIDLANVIDESLNGDDSAAKVADPDIDIYYNVSFKC